LRPNERPTTACSRREPAVPVSPIRESAAAGSRGWCWPLREIVMNGPTCFSAFLLAFVLCVSGCGSRPSAQPFEKAKWNESRKNDPELNACPSMLGDLLTNHLSLGIGLQDVTNLLGDAEVRTPVGSSGVRIRGEFIEQTVYAYRPGMHKGWRLEGTNPLILWFGHNGEYLREWSPQSPTVQPVSAEESEAVAEARRYGRLHVGNLRYAGRPDQFDALLGPPDEKRTEHQLDYFLGKRGRFASDDVFLELHFDASNRLSRMTWSEH
jgi:hypothetical protein